MVAKPTVISLFSGAGGLDYGFEAAGFRTAVAIEMDSDCCNTLRVNRGWPVIERDIHSVPTKEILKTASLKKGEADVLIGGPPCQPFSKAGYWASGDSRRLEDPRSLTLGAYMRVLEEAQPKTFLLENVEGFAFGNKQEGLTKLLNLLDEVNRRTRSNYRPTFRVLNAAEYGVPQLRSRFIMIASRDGAEFQFPSETHSVQGVDGLEKFRTAWDAIGDRAGTSPDEDLSLRGKWAELLPSVPEGENYLWHTDRGKGLPLFGWRRRYWSFLLKLAKAQPSWTLQAQPGPATGPFHWENRLLSMRELCRLQTFPDDVSITGSRNAVQRQVGNAVPSLLGEILGREIRRQLLQQRPSRSLKLLPTKSLQTPKPERPAKVPAKYLPLVGSHAPHPGTGRGYRAALWNQDQAAQ